MSRILYYNKYVYYRQDDFLYFQGLIIVVNMWHNSEYCILQIEFVILDSFRAQKVLENKRRYHIMYLKGHPVVLKMQDSNIKDN